jgi:hypothetical protein
MDSCKTVSRRQAANHFNIVLHGGRQGTVVFFHIFAEGIKIFVIHALTPPKTSQNMYSANQAIIPGRHAPRPRYIFYRRKRLLVLTNK